MSPHYFETEWETNQQVQMQKNSFFNVQVSLILQLLQHKYIEPYSKRYLEMSAKNVDFAAVKQPQKSNRVYKIAK